MTLAVQAMADNGLWNSKTTGGDIPYAVKGGDAQVAKDLNGKPMTVVYLENLDGLNFLAGKRVDEVNKMAELGTQLAHVDGGVPNIKITIPVLDEYNLGQLIYFFERACGISGYVLGVNPFNQPGVEAYKKNMFALLEKPGYEEATKAIKARLEQE